MRDILYWHKSSAIPQINNFGDHFEYFLLFSKSSKIKKNDYNYFDYQMKSIEKSNIWNVKKKFGSVGKKYMVHHFPVEFISRLINIFSNEGDISFDLECCQIGNV